MFRWIFLLLGALPLFGAYIGNPADPSIMSTGFFSSSYPFFKFTSGYVGDYISNKRYVSNEDPNQGLKQFGLHSQFATFSLILVERLELFGNVGGTKEHAKLHKNVTMEDLSEILLDFHSASHFAWSAGGKIVFLQWGQTFLSGDLTYFEVPESNQAFFKFLNRLNLPLEEKQRFQLKEWQGSLAFSSRFFILTPYVGASYLHSRLQVENELEYRNQKNIGFFYGLTLSLTGRFHVNFERRVRDEFAYAFSTIAVF